MDRHEFPEEFIHEYTKLAQRMCRAATFDEDQGRYNCTITGNGCCFMIPDEQACYDKFEEGPIAFDKQMLENGV